MVTLQQTTIGKTHTQYRVSHNNVWTANQGFQNIEKQDQNIALIVFISACTVTSNEIENYKVTYTIKQFVELIRNDENFG